MPTPPRPGDDPELSPDERAVRRLLADARADDGVPDDVAERLDARLADLEAERGGPEADPAHPEVADLSARRRRRAGAALLVAAVAVVAVGIGVRAVTDDAPMTTSESAGSADERSTTDNQQRAAPTDPSDDAQAPRFSKDGRNRAEGGGDTLDQGMFGAAAGPAVRPARFVADVRRLKAAAGVGADSDYEADRVTEPAGFTCSDAHYGQGVLVGVRYQGRPAVLAFRAPMADAQVVDLLQCRTGDLQRSTTLTLH